MGFYAAGEIGPQVEEEAEHAFLRGNAALQAQGVGPTRACTSERLGQEFRFIELAYTQIP